MDNLDRIAARDARIISLQSELLDHTGHVWPGLPATRARELTAEINALRAANGWGPLDLAGRYRPRHVVTEPAYAVTFDPRPATGPGAIAGLRRMPLGEARELVTRAARIPKHGRIIDTATLEEVTS